jgi:hypothetical protein
LSECGVKRCGQPNGSVALTAGLVGAIGWVLAIFHGVEAAIWGAAYRWLGAIGSTRDAMLYSVDSITIRSASGLELEPEWRLMGVLEAADGSGAICRPSYLSALW